MSNKPLLRNPRITVAVLSAVTSAAILATLVVQDATVIQATNPNGIPWALVLRYVFAMGLAGALMGAVFSGLFGRKGPIGWLLALVGGLLVAITAGLVGSAFGIVPDFFYGTVQPGAIISIASGALLPLFALTGRTVLAVNWLVLVLLTHILTRRLRA